MAAVAAAARCQALQHAAGGSPLATGAVRPHPSALVRFQSRQRFEEIFLPLILQPAIWPALHLCTILYVLYVMTAVSSCWCGLSHFAWFLSRRPLVRRDAFKGFNVKGCMCRKERGEERHCQREMLQAAAAKLQRGRLRRMLGSWAAAPAMAAARRQQHRLADAAAARRSSALLPQVGLAAVLAVPPSAVPLRLMDQSTTTVILRSAPSGCVWRAAHCSAAAF